MFANVTSAAIIGIGSYLVQVEVNANSGLPCFTMVGLLSPEVKEAAERVRVALKNVGLSLPPLHITVNLSPAHLRKEGTAFDLPIAVGLLIATGSIKREATEKMLIVGELGLDGAIKKTSGVLPIIREAVNNNYERFLVPLDNLDEAKMISKAKVYGAGTIQEVIELLKGDLSAFVRKKCGRKKAPPDELSEGADDLDFSDIAGQEQAKKAAVISAAGFHNLLLIGPPGTGKTMIARRIPTILPPLTEEESLEVSSIYSIAGMLNKKQAIIRKRPFLNPHYSISAQGLAGGGRIPRPGVVSLSHRGVLFMDELPECNRAVIEILRQPIEDKKVNIARASGSFTYPADFIFLGAMNPCPCGYFPDQNKCNCSEKEVTRYLNRISGPILDRIDICTEVARTSVTALNQVKSGSSSEEMRRQVEMARQIQKERYKNYPYDANADILVKDIANFCCLNTSETLLMAEIYETMNLSLRAYHRILKVARTIADLSGSEKIGEPHLLEAVHFRLSDGRYYK